MSHSYFVDESGDLGWTLNLPYNRGGSSRHLVIACASVPTNQEHRLERVMKDLYKASKWDHKKEKKWIHAPAKSRLHFAQKALQLQQAYPEDVQYSAIVVCKRKVAQHLRDDGNKLYNYMLRRLLIDEMAKRQKVLFYPDPRSIKVESGNSMHDYLSIWLGFELGAPTQLTTLKVESQYSKALQFADMLSGIVHCAYERNDQDCLNILRQCFRIEELFFPC